jgi:aspartyl aminopeptidase
MTSAHAIQMTKHARERQLKRGIHDLQVSLAMDFGQRVHGTGVEYCFLGRSDIPDWVHPRYAERMDGTVVILSTEGTVITTYRNPEYMPRLRKRARLPRTAGRRGWRTDSDDVH